MTFKGAENGKHTGMILIDIQLLLTPYIITLFNKMKCINFSDKTKGLYSYFTNTTFFVSLNNAFSEAGTINWRVPQESILKPLLFLLYILWYSTSSVR